MLSYLDAQIPTAPPFEIKSAILEILKETPCSTDALIGALLQKQKVDFPKVLEALEALVNDRRVGVVVDEGTKYWVYIEPAKGGGAPPSLDFVPDVMIAGIPEGKLAAWRQAKAERTAALEGAAPAASAHRSFLEGLDKAEADYIETKKSKAMKR
ncbi:hypothetical protein LXA47_31295 [Massilia sp. P8910]|uniref:hypothetical protein n=1 Tax=Massilia antarctica TaxID=2765360 RepID=UPI001E3014AD|nr:hypothetical protein [Massilia antarctica]MCE3608057.1 hypothetical protein [Massilia antarctica]